MKRVLDLEALLEAAAHKIAKNFESGLKFSIVICSVWRKSIFFDIFRMLCSYFVR